ncbi:MAG: SulP family inorganic anion transporter [Magnetococcales bacterium]|nr:SulP family inorganic anion transporter [Magnetococcales bacterium]
MNSRPVDFHPEVVHGLRLATLMLPQAMACALLAGVPLAHGLYAALLPPLVAALTSAVSPLSTGPVAMLSLLTGTLLLPYAPPFSEPFVALVLLVTLLTGTIQLLLGLLRCGVMVNVLVHPVMIGAIHAAAIYMAATQMPRLLGLPSPDPQIHLLAWINGMTPQIHWPSLALGGSALALMLLLKWRRPRWPHLLLVTTGATLVSWLTDFATLGGQVVGQVPAGLPSMALPALSTQDLAGVLGCAAIIALAGSLQTSSVVRTMSAGSPRHIDPNREMIAQGLANLAGALTQALPAAGSFSRSALLSRAQVNSPIPALVAALVLTATLLWLTPLLQYLPIPLLGAIVLMMAREFFQPVALWHAWRLHPHDGVVALVTLCTALWYAPHLEIGILYGAALAAVLAGFRAMPSLHGLTRS